MKIALVTDGIMPFVNGGMQKHSYFLAKYLTLNNCDVTLFHCVHSSKLPTDDEVNKSIFSSNHKLKNILTFSFPRSIWFPGHYFYNSYRYSKKVYNAIIKDINQFDFIYVKGLSGWKLLNEKNILNSAIKIGVNFHGMNMFLPVQGLKLKIVNLFFKIIVKKNMILSDYVFSYGSKVTSTILNAHISKNKIIEIPTAIERHFIRDENEIKVNNTINFVFIGRNDPVKALNELFISIKNINVNFNYVFHFIGPIENKIKRENIIYHGLLNNYSDIIKILDNSDVLLLPSYSEGMPNVILEAMSRGLLIIATNVGAVNLMVNNDNGFLIKSPSPVLIQEAMEIILNMDSKDIIKMRINSLNKLKNNFTWEKIASLTLQQISKRL